MALDFTGDDIDTELADYLENGGELSLNLSEENIIEDLDSAIQALLRQLNWIPNAKILNKEEEKQKFIQRWEKDEHYSPEFEFKNPDWDTENALKILHMLESEVTKITASTMERYGAKILTEEDFRKMFRDSLEELRLWVNIVDSIEDREMWQELCLKVWPMVSEETVQNSVEYLKEMEFEDRNLEKNLSAEEVAKSFRQELENLGFEWDVEVRDVSGCHNIPEERTVVVARGSDEERFYSEEERKMLTKHEIFHVVRAYNGIKAGEKSGLPPFLGVHTPFYDMTEEGGAIYREKKTGAFYDEKEFDYHLRLLAAYYMSEGIEFYDVVEKLVEHGGSLERSFSLAARNREIIRHHIYLGGYIEEWEDRENVDSLLIGKVNPEYAELLQKEVEADGMLQGPEIDSSKLFQRS